MRVGYREEGVDWKSLAALFECIKPERKEKRVGGEGEGEILIGFWIWLWGFYVTVEPLDRLHVRIPSAQVERRMRVAPKMDQGCGFS